MYRVYGCYALNKENSSDLYFTTKNDYILEKKNNVGFSFEKETRNNGGKIINPVTGDTRFELTKMDPELYNQVKNLEKGQIHQIEKSILWDRMGSFFIILGMMGLIQIFQKWNF